MVAKVTIEMADVIELETEAGRAENEQRLRAIVDERMIAALTAENESLRQRIAELERGESPD